MSNYSQGYKNYRVLSFTFLILFILLFLGAPAVTASKYGLSESITGWTLFKEVFENIDDIFDAFKLNFLFSLGCALVVAIPIVSFILALRLLLQKEYYQDYILWLTIMTCALVVLILIGLEKFKSIVGFYGSSGSIHVGMGLWGAVAISIAWYIYNGKKEPYMDDDEENEEDDEEEEELEWSTPNASTQCQDNSENEQMAPLHRAYIPKKSIPEISEEMRRTITAMSITELQGVIDYPEIYSSQFVDAARAELEQRVN